MWTANRRTHKKRVASCSVRGLCTHSVMGKELFWIGLFVVEKHGVKIRKTRLKYAKLTLSSTQMGEKGLATLYGPLQNFREAHWNEQNLFGSRRATKKSRSTLQVVFAYTLVWELKPEVRTFVCFEGERGVSSEANFVCFAGLLWTFAMAPYIFSHFLPFEVCA